MTRSNWNDLRINSWNSFIACIESLELQTEFYSQWIFRGQANSDWTLKPSIVRHIERHNIDRNQALKYELQGLNEFTKNARLYSELDSTQFNSGNKMIMLSKMQHYGAPTRLLDWTMSPFIALYFAVSGDFSNDGAVYLFNTLVLTDITNLESAEFKTDESKFLSNVESDFITVIHVNSPSRRSNSQQGIYTIAANIEKDHEILIGNPLDIKSETDNKTYHSKLTIDKSLKHEFLSRLWNMNVKADLLYPDLFGFSNSIKDLFEIRGWQDGKFKESDR